MPLFRSEVFGLMDLVSKIELDGRDGCGCLEKVWFKFLDGPDYDFIDRKVRIHLLMALLDYATDVETTHMAIQHQP